MLKKTAIVVVIFILVKLVDGCRCPEPDIFRWNSISTQTLQNNVVTSADSILFSDYGIGMTVESQQIAMCQPGFIDAAFARKCASHEMESNIKQVDIQTVSSFDSSHAAGSDITSYCKTLRVINLSAPSIPVSELGDLISIQDLNEFNIFFTQNPSSSGYYQFVVNIRLENGTVLTNTTRSVKLY